MPFIAGWTLWSHLFEQRPPLEDIQLFVFQQAYLHVPCGFSRIKYAYWVQMNLKIRLTFKD